MNKSFVRAKFQPSANQEMKLQRLVNTYRDAIKKAVDENCTTLSEVNEIVTPYDLPYQAKDALKTYVPMLVNKYNISRVRSDHPVRMVNRAAKIDFSSNEGFIWNVPQPGRKTNFKVVLHTNLDQQNYWMKIANNKIKKGGLLLQKTNRNWIVQIKIRNK